MKNTETASSGHPSALPDNYYWFFILYMVALSAFGSFVNDMYTPSLPAMARGFHTSAPVVQLGLSLGMAGLGLGQVILGPVSDKVGRKPVLTWSLILFTVACVVSVFSPTIEFFLVCRFFQGIGASSGYFLGRTMPADVTGGRTLAKMMAIIGAINGVAPASAPVLGGILADCHGWQSVFVVLALMSVALLAFLPRLRESLPPSRRQKGSLWKSFGAYGSLLRNRPFMTHVLLKGAALGLLFAYMSALPFILQEHYGLSQTLFGLVTGFNALFTALGSFLALRFKPLKKAAFAGGILLFVSFAGEAVSLWCIHSFWVFEAWMIPAVFGLGLIFTPANTLAMNEGRADAGTSSAVLGVTGYIFGMIVTPLVGLGNVLHSTAIVFMVLGVLVAVVAYASVRLAPDLDPAEQK